MSDISSKVIKFFVSLTVLCFCGAYQVSAQVPIYDQAPPSVKWQQIVTPHMIFVFPEEFEAQAQKLASLADTLHHMQTTSLGAQPRPIQFIMQNRILTNNGFVTVNPWHSQLYVTPTQDYNFTGNADWTHLLLFHEYRHVVQYGKADQGLAALIRKYFIGNPALSLAGNLGAPDWFWEGDAVYAETVMTEKGGGRGEIPNFSVQFRTTLLEKGPWSYSKQALGSYKHLVANHYVFGYFFAAYINETYGDDVWDKITEASFGGSEEKFTFRLAPYWPFSFSNAMKYYTGYTLTQNYNHMIKYVTAKWEQQAEATEPNPEPVQQDVGFLFNERRYFTDFSSPVKLENGDLISVRKGLGDFYQFVRIDESDGKVKRVHVPGFVKDNEFLAAGKNSLAWIEFQYHPRYAFENYNVIKVWNAETSKVATYGKKSRYLSVDISRDASKLVAIQSLTDYTSELVVIDVATSKTDTVYSTREATILTPRWSPDGQQIIFISFMPGAGRSLKILDLTTTEVKTLHHFGYENIGIPYWEGDYVYYNSPYSGIDNIYALHIPTGKRYQVTNARYGAYNVFPHEGDLYFNVHTFEGKDVVKINRDIKAWTPVEQVKDQTIDFAGDDEHFQHEIASLQTDMGLPVTKYKSRLFNPFAWSILDGTGADQVRIGVRSRNVLNTSVLSAGYNYDVNGFNGYFFGNVSYQKYWPVFDLEVREGARSNLLLDQNSVEVRENWNETNLSLITRIPVNLTRSRFVHNFTLSGALDYTNVRNFDLETRSVSRLANGGLFSYRLTGNYNLFHKASQRHINTPLGISLVLDYQKTLPGSDYEGQLFVAQAFTSVRGIMPHHSVNIRAGWQYAPPIDYSYQIENDSLGRQVITSVFVPENFYLFPTRLALPRGGEYRLADQYFTAGFSYELPIMYPDLPVWSLLYLQRIRVKPFFDVAKSIRFYDLPAGFSDFTDDRVQQTAGLELMFDFNVIRRRPALSAGVRFSYNFDEPFGLQNIRYDFLTASLGF